MLKKVVIFSLLLTAVIQASQTMLDKEFSLEERENLKDRIKLEKDDSFDVKDETKKRVVKIYDKDKKVKAIIIKHRYEDENKERENKLSRIECLMSAEEIEGFDN